MKIVLHDMVDPHEVALAAKAAGWALDLRKPPEGETSAVSVEDVMNDSQALFSVGFGKENLNIRRVNK